MDIREVLGKRNKEAIFDLKVKIENVKPLEHKVWEDKKFTSQSVLFSDATGTIWGQLNNCTEISQDATGEIVLLSSKETKHGLQGVLVNEYPKKDGTKGKNIKITPTATFCIGYNQELRNELPKPKLELERTIAQKIVGEIEKPVGRPFVTPTEYQASDTDLEKVRSMAVSYAKDLCVANRITIDFLFKQANLISDYIKTGHLVAEPEHDMPTADDEVIDNSCSSIPF